MVRRTTLTRENLPDDKGLTPDLLSQICPVARSDRRVHRHLFAELGSEEVLKDDAFFYSALLTQIRSDHVFLNRFSSGFLDSKLVKDKKKSFEVRALRWLHQRVETGVSKRDIPKLSEDYFPAHSPERELHFLYKALQRTSAGDGEEHYSGDSAEVETVSWIATRDRLRVLLEELGSPDPGVAAKIRSEAEALVLACATAAKSTAEMDRLAVLRNEMTNQLSALGDIHEAEILRGRIGTADAVTLETLAGALDGLAMLRNSLSLAEDAFAEKRVEYEEANSSNSKDWRRISAVTEKMAALDEEREKAQQDIRNALSAALLLLDTTPAVARTIPPPSTKIVSSPQKQESASIEVVPAGDLGSAPKRSPQPHRPATSEIEVHAESKAKSVESSTTSPESIADRAAHRLAEPDSVFPTVWVATQPLNQLLAHYLEAREYALAWHLADLASERGFTPPLPAAVLKALALVPSIAGPFDAATQQTGEALADAMAAVEVAEASVDEGASERVRAIAFAALLRSALLAPETTARTHLSNLSMRGGLASYAGLRNALVGLGRDFHPTVDDLAELAGVERERRLPSAVASLRLWLDQTRSAQSSHAPTSVILHQILAPQGHVGRVVEAALAGKAKADQSAGELIQILSDRVAQEKLIADYEHEMGRTRRDRIRNTALDWLCRKLREGRERLQDWLVAVAVDREMMDDRRRQVLQRQIGAVKRALTEVGSVDNTEGQRIDGAVAGIVQYAVKALRLLVEGRELMSASQRQFEVLDLPLLRLPGGCQPHAPQPDDRAFAEECAAQRMRLFAALQDPATLAADELAGFEARRAEGAILPARRLLDRLKQVGTLSGEAAESAEQALAEAKAAARVNAQREVEALRLELATLYNLDLGTGDTVRHWLDRLDAVTVALAPAAPSAGSRAQLPALDGPRDPDIPPDFPELWALLTDIRHFRDDLRERIAKDQRARLERLTREMPEQAEVAQELAKTLRARDPVTVEDMIAQLQAGLPLAGPEAAEQDAFAAFFPGFVESIAGAAPEALNRGLIDAALKDAGTLGPLDFSGLDVDAQRAAVHLLERWRRADNVMKQTAGDIRDALRQLMEAVGFISVSITSENQLIPGRLRRFQMRADPLVAERWFLPPVFGSEAGGRYPVFLARPEVQDDQLATELGKVGRESPCLLLIFGRLSRQRRESFARRMRRDKQSVLMIDDTQILFLATGSADRMERLVTCAAPFGYLQPYTTNAGNIPREMFFGRREEIDKIVSRRSDGCLVYGGRQLGKSALLHHVRKLYDSPTSGARAQYLKIDVIGAHGTPASQIWSEIGGALAEEKIGEKGQGTPDAVIVTVRTWLGADPARRLLMLLDESDAFLAAESRTGFPNLGRLKDLMEETARRFKVVFAGLHNVRRMAQAPNSPLVHLGDPICIGPLNTTAESSAAARRLVTAPMRAAGFDYERPELAWDILARVNHYPSLVQVFCKAMLEGLSNQPRPAGEGPRWQLARGQIFEGSSAQEINRQIRERFQWTLNLDPRYELIAKVLAHCRLERADGDAAVLRTGLLAEEIATETAEWWPKGFDRPGREDFRAFLDEMVDLGVLARYGARQERFGLRSAQVAQMLGQRDEIEEQIMRIHEKEPQVDYDATQFHRRIALDDPTRRSPLADRALADLFDTDRPGPRILAAAPALWGADLAERLRDLASNWRDGKGQFSATLNDGSASGLRGLFERNKGARQIVVLPGNGSWNLQVIEGLARQPAVRAGSVIPICLAPPAWLAARRLGSDTSLPARIITPRPWGEVMLRAWLEEFDLASLDQRQLRESILAGSGGAPVLLEAARPMLEQIVAAGTDPEKEIRDWVTAQQVSSEMAGLPAKYVAPFRELADLVVDRQEDFSAIRELLAPVKSEPGPKLERLLLLFADLGLVRSGDPVREGVALTQLGRLVARSISKL